MNGPGAAPKPAMTRHAAAAGALTALSLVTSTALAVPTVGPEYEIDPPIVTGQAVVPRVLPSVASNGGIFLVVFAAEDTVRARRVDATGALLDTSDIVIASFSTNGSILAVEADGDDFVILYYDTSGVRLARVDDTGAVASDVAGPATTSLPHVVRGTDGFLVTSGGTSPPNVWLIDFDGSALAGPIAPINAPCAGMDASHAGNVYLVTCRNGFTNRIYAARLNETGAVLDSPELELITAASTLTDPIVGTSGTEFLVVTRNVLSDTVTGRRVDTSGNIVGAAITFAQMPTDIGFVNGNYDFVHGATHRRYTTAGVSVDASAISFSAATATQSRIAAMSTTALATFLDSSSSVKASLIGPTGAPSVQDLTISQNLASSSNAQTLIGAASNDAGTSLVLWSDSRAGAVGCHGARLDSSGDPLGTQFYLEDHTCFSVASNGQDFMIMYLKAEIPCAGCGTLHARPIAADGTLGAEVEVTTSANHVSGRLFTSDGTNYAYASTWRSGIVGDPAGQYYVGVLDSDGEPIGPAEDLQSSGPEGGIDIAYDGTNYFISWALTANTAFDSYSQRMTSGGALTPTATALGAGYAPTIAYAAGSRLVSTQASRTVHTSTGRRLAADNTILDAAPFALSALAVTSLTPRPSGFWAITSNSSPTNDDIGVVELGADGQPGDSFDIANSADDERGAIILNHGQYVVYQHLDPADGFRNKRVRARKLQQDNGTPCDDEAQCASQFCVDGVCCENECDAGMCDASGVCIPDQMGEGGAGGAGGAGGTHQGGSGGEAPSGGAAAGGGQSSADGGQSSVNGGQSEGGGGASNEEDGEGARGGCASCSVDDRSADRGWVALALGFAAAGLARRRRSR